MAERSLENSAQAEKPPYASMILLTHLAEGYAMLRIRLGDRFTRCSPSLLHEYLWALGETIEQAQANLDRLWEEELRAIKGAS